MRRFSIIMVLLSLLALSLHLQGCNTIRGFGQDVEQAGDAIEDAAE